MAVQLFKQLFYAVLQKLRIPAFRSFCKTSVMDLVNAMANPRLQGSGSLESDLNADPDPVN